MTWIWLGLVCYGIGSLPTAYLFTRYILGQDIRDIGDNNSGAAKVLVDDTGMEMMAGAAALAGHNFPVHLKFRGGRGAATAVGVLIASVPIVGLPIGVFCLVLLYFTHKAIYPLAVFLVAIPALTWPAGYSVSLAIYAVAMPMAVGLSHFFTTRVLNPGAGSKS